MLLIGNGLGMQYHQVLNADQSPKVEPIASSSALIKPEEGIRQGGPDPRRRLATTKTTQHLVSPAASGRRDEGLQHQQQEAARVGEEEEKWRLSGQNLEIVEHYMTRAFAIYLLANQLVFQRTSIGEHLPSTRHLHIAFFFYAVLVAFFHVIPAARGR
ncbi:hypothetical protein PCASD_12449 [Puccinia coronata f. sp. avenae]|nr:hypothetical protein PCASD_24310 [Puccinia coronata f. sp. avenae]PLW31124.1 hypothetical protein PCASD_12449 [Puccinia coronata f. sp. avenae]